MMKIKLKYMLLSCVLLFSCTETSDVSYEREAIKFEAERNAAKSQVLEKEARIKELRSELDVMRVELASRPKAPSKSINSEMKPSSDPESSIKVDANKVRLGLMNEVDKLKKIIEQEKEDIKVKNYSLGKVEIDTDFPFNASVIMNIYSTKKNAQNTLYWSARGNLNGEWVLSNTGKQNSMGVEVTKTTSGASSGTLPTAGGDSDPTVVADVSDDQLKVKPKLIIKAKPGEHVIDWSKIE